MASTFVNNLRLEEMATGEQSGTWGTKTNTNLELIGEALGFGTEAITTNANTHTTTVADATSDAGRAMFIKYTGALDSDCTITIGPNTMKRVHIIENATTDSGSSGPYNIIISQGSGANITIANGTAKVVYLDGAGSGAAVVDAFAHLAAVDLTVDDDLIVKDDVSLTSDGAVLSFGADSEIALTHVADTGLKLTDSGGTPTLQLHDSNEAILSDGSNLKLTSGGTTFTVPSSDGSDGQFLKTDGSGALSFATVNTTTALDDIATGDAASTLATSAGNITIDAQGNDTDIIFKGTDNSSDITMLTLDGSEAGAATFNDKIILGSGKEIQFVDTNESIQSDGSKLIVKSGGTTFNLPTSDGSSGQFLKTDGSGTLSFQTVSSGASLANDANNRVVTATGSGGINGESNFKWSGQNGTMNRNSDGGVLDFLRSNSSVGNVSVFQGACSFNNTSDYRAKNNIADMDEATSRLKQLQCKKFSMKQDTDNTMRDGFIAHEVDPIVPQAVTGEKDAVDEDGNPDYQSIDTSQLVPLLVKTVQELEARITALESS